MNRRGAHARTRRRLITRRLAALAMVAALAALGIGTALLVTGRPEAADHDGGRTQGAPATVGKVEASSRNRPSGGSRGRGGSSVPSTPTTARPSTPTTAPPTSPSTSTQPGGGGTGQPSQATSTTPKWRVAWGSAMGWGYGTAADTTVRDLAVVGASGSQVRVRISNLFGNQPLVLGAATVAQSAGGPALVPGTLHPLTFGGQPGVTVPIGAVVTSDPVPMTVQNQETLAITVFVPGTDLVTLHPCCTNVTSYFSPNGGGNLTGSVTGAGLSYSSPWDRWVDSVDLLEDTGKGSIVVVGDSITDGYHSTLRWTDVLQERIDQLPATEQRAVINEGITANALTSVVHTDELTGGGPSGLARLASDALDQPGVSEVVLFLGTNDLWFGATASQLITGYEQAIAQAHQAGIPIIGVTLLPRSSSVEELWTPTDQAELQQVDAWILHSGAFNGVLDLAGAVADIDDGACAPTLMYPPYDSGDNLHPNAAGQTAMADAVQPSVLGLPPLPQVPPLVAATPTPACSAGLAAASSGAW